jgi:hypothetical protein
VIRRFWSKRHAAPFVGAVAAFALAGPARAEGPPPPPDEISAADAYRESIPTAGGPKPTGASERRSRLAPAISARLGRGATSTFLRDVATSAAYGAPQSRLRPPAGSRPVRAGEVRAPSFGAATDAFGDAVGRGRLTVLASVLFAILAVGVTARLAHARVRSR